MWPPAYSVQSNPVITIHFQSTWYAVMHSDICIDKVRFLNLPKNDMDRRFFHRAFVISHFTIAEMQICIINMYQS